VDKKDPDEGWNWVPWVLYPLLAAIIVTVYVLFVGSIPPT
jgi:hypothetical protein